MNDLTRLALVTTVAACAAAAPKTPPSNKAPTMISTLSPAAADLAGKLDSGAFGDFWNYAVHDDVVDTIWGQPDSQARLEAIVRAPVASPRARLLACETLFTKELGFLRAVDVEEVAEIYATALAGNLTGRANSWGLLYEEDDAGPVGIRFVMLGEPAIPALRRLLGDGRTVLQYEGSEDATVGNGYGYRVKDFAAYYLSKIVRVPLAYHAAPADRDREIETRLMPALAAARR